MLLAVRFGIGLLFTIGAAIYAYVNLRSKDRLIHEIADVGQKQSAALVRQRLQVRVRLPAPKSCRFCGEPLPPRKRAFCSRVCEGGACYRDNKDAILARLKRKRVGAGVPDAPDAAALQTKELELRQSGLKYREIAEALGYRSRQGAHEAAAAAKLLRWPPKAEELKRMQNWFSGPSDPRWEGGGRDQR